MNSLQLNYWLKQHWKLLVLIFIVILILGQTIYQIVYPSSRLIPGTVVDGVNVGGLKYADAAKKLDGLYGDIKLDIFFGHNGAAFQSPKMSEVGIGVDNTERLSAITYPIYLRFIPGSIWWAPSLGKPGEIAYTYDKNKISDYTQSKVGSDCSIPFQNASLKLIESQLQLVPSVAGGKCDITLLQQKLAEVQPDSGVQNTIRISIDETPAPVTDDMARDLAAKLNGRFVNPMPITVDTSSDTIPGRVVLSWLDFRADVPAQVIDNSANQTASIKFSVNQKRMEEYLNQGIAEKLIKKPGVSKISTLDFKETSRVNGANGRTLDMVKASQSVEDYSNSKKQTAVGATQEVGPTLVYSRSYSPTSVGFTALLTQYAQDNPGVWGLAFTELNGVSHPRSASYNADTPIKSGGVHSLYLAYTEVMEEAAKTARPVDIISGETNALECFKDMLQKFDEGCRVGFYDHFGYETLTSRAAGLGLTRTKFAGEDTITSANDVHKLMVGLFKNTIARAEGGQKILSAIRSVRNNEGIPVGAGKGQQVSHIIGENDTVHNDTAFVNSTNYGTYALTVLSDGSSWDKVAGLAKKVQALKQVKIPKDAR
ncbi:MAG: serine hydrolase [Candidatus Saccharimonadales bacterium]